MPQLRISKGTVPVPPSSYSPARWKTRSPSCPPLPLYTEGWIPACRLPARKKYSSTSVSATIRALPADTSGVVTRRTVPCHVHFPFHDEAHIPVNTAIKNMFAASGRDSRFHRLFTRTKIKLAQAVQMK